MNQKPTLSHKQLSARLTGRQVSSAQGLVIMVDETEDTIGIQLYIAKE